MLSPGTGERRGPGARAGAGALETSRASAERAARGAARWGVAFKERIITAFYLMSANSHFLFYMRSFRRGTHILRLYLLRRCFAVFPRTFGSIVGSSLAS